MTQNDTDPWYSPRDISTTLVKGMTVLSAFDCDQIRLTLPEIGRITGYDRATVRRLVITLVDLGFIIKTDRSFALTPKVLALSGHYLRSHGVGTTVQPVLDKYSEPLGKEISLATLSDGAALYIARSNLTGSTVSFGFTIGSRLPILHTAIGRMLLATAQPDTRSALIEAGALIQYTNDSLLDRPAILKDVEKAYRQGFALVSNEFEAGVAGLAVPVGRLGKANAVLGISSAATDLNDASVHEHYLDTLQLCATELDRVWREGP